MLQEIKNTENLNVRGALTENEPLGTLSWFRTGGDADLLFRPDDLDDLVSFLRQYPSTQPLTVLGGLANTIIRDGGIRGCVIQLSKGISDVGVDGVFLSVGAGAFNGTVASVAAKNGIGGLEFLSGIPGSIGGAVFMNAGAYGREVKDVLVEVYALARNGDHHVLKPNHLNMSYRHSDLPEGFIIIGAKFKGVAENEKIVRVRLKEIKLKRNQTQPIKEQTGGSTFANPNAQDLKKAGMPSDMKAWEIVDKVGGRALNFNGACMSKKHANFMINTGDANAADLEKLGDEIIARVKKEYDLDLRWEIKRIGDP